jgi:FkbM family methyltransferase
MDANSIIQADERRSRGTAGEVLGWLDLVQGYAAVDLMPVPPPPVGDPETYGVLYDAFSSRQSLSDYDHVHAVRFRATASLLGPYLEKAKRIVELGGHSRIGVFAGQTFGADYRSYEQDLRYRFDLPDSAFNSVLCLEVLEHIKDVPESETSIDLTASFNYDGVMNLLRESFRILKPGGVLLITTPNASSVDVIARVLRGDPPHLFDPHVRELSPKQVRAFGERAGFKLEAFGTYFAWQTADDELRSRIIDFVVSAGFNPADRGDDAVYVFRKPGLYLAPTATTAAECAAFWRAEHKRGTVPDYEEILSQGFTRFIEKGDVVIDVGVNQGRHFKRLKELVGPKGRVIGFEPVPELADYSKAYAGEDSEIRQLALSAGPGRAEFLFMSKAIGESGFKERASEGDRGAVPIQVEISTLDIQTADLERLDYIKIDTEGHEIDILEGGREAIARLRPVISVEWGEPTYSLYGHDMYRLYDLCEELGYRIADLFGFVVADREEWALVSDQSYWDFFLVPTERVDIWRARMQDVQ